MPPSCQQTSQATSNSSGGWAIGSSADALAGVSGSALMSRSACGSDCTGAGAGAGAASRRGVIWTGGSPNSASAGNFIEVESVAGASGPGPVTSGASTSVTAIGIEIDGAGGAGAGGDSITATDADEGLSPPLAFAPGAG